MTPNNVGETLIAFVLLTLAWTLAAFVFGFARAAWKDRQWWIDLYRERGK